MTWRESDHPRDWDGKFTRVGAGDWAQQLSDRIGGRSTPLVLSPAEFDRTVPEHQRLYRGVSGPAGAAHNRKGNPGGGDFGKGIYFGSLGTGQSYMGRQGGVLVRAAVVPGAKIRRPPERVILRGSSAIDKWAEENGVDVVEVGTFRVVRNPGKLIFDSRDYTVEESVVLDFLADGYTLSGGNYDEYHEPARRLAKDLDWNMGELQRLDVAP